MTKSPHFELSDNLKSLRLQEVFILKLFKFRDIIRICIYDEICKPMCHAEFISASHEILFASANPPECGKQVQDDKNILFQITLGSSIHT